MATKKPTKFANPAIGRIELVDGEPRWLVPVEACTPDPANTNIHSPQSLMAIRGSLRRFGQKKPIVLSADRVIVAGNGTYLAAIEEGMTEVWVTQSGLTGTDATAYAIADNRVAEFSERDDEAIGRFIRQMAAEGSPLEGMGFDDADLAQMLAAAEGAPDTAPDTADTGPQVGNMEYKLIVDCSDEVAQAQLLSRLEEEGYQCRPLIA